MTDESQEKSHYFSERPDSPRRESTYQFLFDGESLTVTTDSGVFSSRGLDKGTAILLRHIALPEASLPDGDLVDLGCGAGPLTIALARHFRDRTVWAIDVNERARELTRRNAIANDCTNVRVSGPEECDANAIAAIFSNPPIRIGKAALHEILATWLDRMTTRGLCRLVVSKNLGADSLQAWLEDEGYSSRRIASKSGYRVLEISHS